jgi:hypothetical protein
MGRIGALFTYIFEDFWTKVILKAFLKCPVLE